MNLIYLHGFASSPQSSKAQFFRRRFEELGVEMRIPDLNQGDFEHLTLGGQLRLIEEVATGDDVCLMGSSMGGYLAALYAARHTEVSKVALLAPAFGFARRWRAMLGEAKVQEWRRSGSLPHYHYGEKMERNLGYELLEEAEQYEDYPLVRQPALIFHGRADDVVPCEYSQEFAERNSQVQLRIVESGHELLNVLDLMWEEVREFLAV
jgi:pimeloyl-ACP methyl ester carboxylesterase